MSVERDAAQLESFAAAQLALKGLAAGDAFSGGGITEITQLSLATAEGITRGYVRLWNGKQPNPAEQIARAYLRWAAIQGIQLDREATALSIGIGWLGNQEVMRVRRPQGETTRLALAAIGPDRLMASNQSKGSGCVPRAAACGLLPGQSAGTEQAAAFSLGWISAGITHGHPLGRLSAGVFAATLAGLATGSDLETAAVAALESAPQDEVDGTAIASLRPMLETALARGSGPGSYQTVGELPGWTGYVAEEALAIGLWAVAGAEGFDDALRRATGHPGERHTTAAICGALWGCRAGAEYAAEDPLSPRLDKPVPQVDDVVPEDLLRTVEGGALIETVALDLVRISAPGVDPTPIDRVRWPGW